MATLPQPPTLSSRPRIVSFQEAIIRWVLDTVWRSDYIIVWFLGFGKGVIENHDISQAHRNYFEALWQISIPRAMT
ncbi:MAG: hypothetical protein Q7S37_04800 [bacterium]|nr:hypothetical protein [bacterium]